MENKIHNTSESEIDLRVIWNTLLREKLLIFLFTIISTSGTIIFSYLVKPTYSGSFNIIVKDDSEKPLYSNQMVLDIISPGTNKNKTQELILKSPLVLMPVFEYVNNYYKENNINKKFLSFSEWQKEVLDVKFQNKSEILKVTYKSHDKKLIIDSLNLISKKYQDYSKRDREKNVVNTLTYLKTQKEILKNKSLLSSKELNKFSITNGLGNIDGFVDIGKPSSIEGTILRLGNQRNNLSPGLIGQNFQSDSSNAGQRFKSQYNLLEKYETQYIDLSSKLKPESLTLKNLKFKIENLRSSLKRPNEILIKYKELLKISRRDSFLLKQIEDNLELTKLEQAKSPDPWELISMPIINPGRVFPNRKLLTLLSFIYSLFAGSIIALIKDKRSGLIFEVDELKRLIFSKYLDKIYLRNISLSKDLINKIIENQKNELNNKEIIGLSIFNNDDSNFITKLIGNNKNIKNINIKEETKANSYDKLIIIINTGINRYQIEFLNKYIFINDKKIIGWLFIDRDTKF